MSDRGNRAALRSSRASLIDLGSSLGELGIDSLVTPRTVAVEQGLDDGPMLAPCGQRQAGDPGQLLIIVSKTASFIVVLHQQRIDAVFQGGQMLGVSRR